MDARRNAAIPYSAPATGHARTVAAASDHGAGTRGVSDPPGPPSERPIGGNRGSLTPRFVVLLVRAGGSERRQMVVVRGAQGAAGERHAARARERSRSAATVSRNERLRAESLPSH